jgi:hypothetical protein
MIRVGESVEQPLVNLVADVPGEASDFAVAAVIEQGIRFRGRSRDLVVRDF